jgi:hypothetical protein
VSDSRLQEVDRVWLSFVAWALLMLAILVLLSACTSVNLDLGVGYDKYIEQGTNPRGLFRVNAERAECAPAGVACFVEFDHHSSIFDGKPFNRNAEQVANQWSAGVRVPLWKK